MLQKKKSGAMTFLCSFLPGAAEMYMGFMKMGISLMAIFFASFFFPTLFQASDIFIGFTFLLWFFGFFHARNLATCEEQAFQQLEDKYIWEEFFEGKSFNFTEARNRKLLAIILVLLGCGMLWNNVKSLIYHFIPDVIWQVVAPMVNKVPGIIFAILMIYIGLKLIRGKKEELDGITDNNANS